MALDFTGLNNIASNKVNPTEDANKHDTATLNSNRCDLSLEALKGLIMASSKGTEEIKQEPVGNTALIKLRGQQEEHLKILEAYKEYQGNIRRSEELRTEILKGMKKGEQVQYLFLQAVECISSMTGDKAFFNQIEAELLAIYGEGLLNKIPLEWKLQETEDRLNKLREACSRDATSPDSKKRIEQAIREHELEIVTLKELLTKADNHNLKDVI